MSASIEFVPDWLFTNKMLEIIDNFVFFNDNIDLDCIDSDVVTFLSDDMDLNTMNFNNINLNDNDDEEDVEDLWFGVMI